MIQQGMVSIIGKPYYLPMIQTLMVNVGVFGPVFVTEGLERKK